MKIYILLFVALVSEVTVFSQTAEQLMRDKNLVSYVTLNLEIQNELAEQFTSQELKQRLDDLQQKNIAVLDEKQQLQILSEMIRLKEPDGFIKYYSKLNELKSALFETYGQITDIEVFINAANTIQTEQMRCRNIFGYIRCTTVVGLQGALLLSTCSGSTLGLGAPVCTGIAVLYAAEGVSSCTDKYCK